MKKILFLLSASLLISCGNGTEISSSSASLTTSEESSSISEESSFEESSIESSEESFISSSEEDTQEEVRESVADFMARLELLDGNVNKVDAKSLTKSYLLSESGALESLNYQEYSGVRYGSSSVGPITCFDGTYKFSIWGGEFSDPYPFSRQIYHEGKYFYRITDYYDEQDREEEKILYTAENEESVLSLSLYYEELSLTGTLLSYLGDKEYSVGFSCLDDISEDGEHTYSYFINQYVDESQEALLKSVTYEKTITVMDNKIVSRIENMENALYAAGEKGNWNIVTTEMSLSYGDYGVYEGEVFSHS